MLSLDWSILWVIINLLVLYFLLKKFLFDRVTGMMDKRRQIIKNNLDEAEAAKADANQLKAEYEQSLKDAHAKAVEITENAKANASKQEERILADARDEGARIIREAEKAASDERSKMLDDAKYEIADLALVAAAKVMNKKLDSDDDRRLAESFVNEVGESDDNE